jgi:hypothetical protein
LHDEEAAYKVSSFSRANKRPLMVVARETEEEEEEEVLPVSANPATFGVEMSDESIDWEEFVEDMTIMALRVQVVGSKEGSASEALLQALSTISILAPLHSQNSPASAQSLAVSRYSLLVLDTSDSRPCEEIREAILAS